MEIPELRATTSNTRPIQKGSLKKVEKYDKFYKLKNVK